MPLTLVLGPANAAKAAEVLGAHAAAARAGRDPRLVVPTAADALHYDRELAGGGAVLGRALTFAGLVEQLARAVGHTAPVAAPLVRELTLRRAIAATDLDAVADSAASPGFALAAGRFFARLAGARVTPQRLLAATDRSAADPQDRELARLYRRYVTDLAATGVLDPESHAWATLDALGADPTRWGGIPVFLYGFDDLTPIELAAVETLARAAEVTVSLTYEPGRTALAARAGIVETLRTLADRTVALEAQDTYYDGPELHHLERWLFEPEPPVLDAGMAVTRLEAGGERAEAELVAAEVLEALRAGVPPAEMVVLSRSLARSGALLESALERYGVPVTSARRVPLAHTAVGRGVLAVLEGDVLTFLRLTRPPEEVDPVEAAARRRGRPVTGELPAVAAAIDELLPRSAGRPLTPEERLDVRAAARLRAALEELGPLTPDETVELIARLEVDAADAPGGVLVAEPLAVRARRFRRVWVTGLNDGEFPRTDAPDPFLSEDRRRRLALEAGLVLDPEPDAAARERYLLYACISRARERIAFSHRTCDEDGAAVARSPFLDDVLAPFRDVPVRSRGLADVVWAPDRAPTPREWALATVPVTGAGAGENTCTRTLDPRTLEHVRHTRRISPSGIESFGRCPVAWLVERQLGPDRLEPDSEAQVRGQILHDLLARTVAGQTDALDTAEPPADLAPDRPEPVRRAILAGIVAQARRYLAWETEHPLPGFRTDPENVERPFASELSGGLAVTGTIDRIDVDAGGRAIVRDYKSGRDLGSRSAARWIEEATLQAGLYLLVVRRELGLDPVAGIYQPLAGRDLRPRGVGLAETGLALRPGDVVDRAGLDALLLAVEAELERLAATLAAGELTPCPATCSPNGCRHPGLCWADR